MPIDDRSSPLDVIFWGAVSRSEDPASLGAGECLVVDCGDGFDEPTASSAEGSLSRALEAYAKRWEMDLFAPQDVPHPLAACFADCTFVLGHETALAVAFGAPLPAGLCWLEDCEERDRFARSLAKFSGYRFVCGWESVPPAPDVVVAVLHCSLE